MTNRKQGRMNKIPKPHGKFSIDTHEKKTVGTYICMYEIPLEIGIQRFTTNAQKHRSSFMDEENIIQMVSYKL